MASKRSPNKTAAKKTAAKKSPKKAAKKAPKKKKAAKKKKAPKKKRAKSKKPVKDHYVNAKDFYDQIKTYYETEIIPDVLSVSLLKIATGLSFAPNFINYSYKDEMIGDAILKMFSAIRNKKFDVSTKNNPFSYFTTIAFHAFINRIKKEKKHRETITKYQEAFYGDTLNEDQNSQVYIDPCNPTDDD